MIISEHQCESAATCVSIRDLPSYTTPTVTVVCVRRVPRLKYILSKHHMCGASVIPEEDRNHACSLKSVYCHNPPRLFFASHKRCRGPQVQYAVRLLAYVSRVAVLLVVNPSDYFLSLQIWSIYREYNCTCNYRFRKHKPKHPIAIIG